MREERGEKRWNRLRRPAGAAAFALFLFATVPGEAGARVGDTTRVSVDNSGAQTLYGHASGAPSISADGRYVAFESWAPNLVAADTNGMQDVFVHDRRTGQISRVSVDSSGNQGNAASFGPVISGDGRYVAFPSYASNLVPGDTNGDVDVFVHDRVTGETTRVSVDSAGQQANNASLYPAINWDGRYVAFTSWASNLVPGDTDVYTNVFLHDRATGQTTMVDVDNDGNHALGGSHYPSLSWDGRYVAFESGASNLVPGDEGNIDVFVRDRLTNQTAMASVDSFGTPGDSHSYLPRISGDGRFVAFESEARNLVPGEFEGTQCIYVRDRLRGQTSRVSVNDQGHAAEWSGTSSISGDGRYVAFGSDASDLVPGDTNGAVDIFVRDRAAGVTRRVSVDSSGNQGNGDSGAAAISADGRTVAFDSQASNLVSADTNDSGDVFVHGCSASIFREADFDGDGSTDFTVWRPSNGTWYAKPTSMVPPLVAQWGDNTLGDIPVPGDYDDDSRTDVAVWRPSDGKWYVMPSSGMPPIVVQWGDAASGDIPTPGDFDGDGRTDFAVWRPSNGTWYVKSSLGPSPMVVQWGDLSSGDVPVRGDFDGDGSTDVAVWRPSNGTWYVKPSSGIAPLVVQWGDHLSGDIPVPGDYDNDSKTDFAVWRPSNGTWYVKCSSGAPPLVVQWGDNVSGDIPVPGDYDNDSKTDFAVWRPSTGTWYARPSSGVAPIVAQWGDQSSGDKPVNRPVHLWASP